MPSSTPRKPPRKITPELYARAWTAYQIAQRASDVARECSLTPQTAKKLVVRGYADYGFPALHERWLAEQAKRQSLDLYPASVARAEMREALANLRKTHRQLADALHVKLAHVAKQLNADGSQGLAVDDADVWSAQRHLAASGRDLTAMEAALYGDIEEHEGPTIVVLRDLGAEPMPVAASEASGPSEARESGSGEDVKPGNGTDTGNGA